MERVELARRLGAEPHGENEPAVIEGGSAGHAAEFMAALARAVAGRGSVFLADPAWKEAERAVLAEVVAAAREASAGERGWLMIPSGGTTGRVKFARHDAATLAAAARGFAGHFSVPAVNAINILPLHHVSGLMPWMRCVVTGGKHVVGDWKRIEAGEFPDVPAGGAWFLSLVPTQLQRLLGSARAVEWLRKFRAVCVGGGPAWAALLEQGADARLPLAVSYGMTETAAMVTALRPEEFLAGGRNCGAALPHARVTIGAEGGVSVAGESLFRGYFPAWREARAAWVTGDVGELDARGRLRIFGRRDAVIITGGKKVDPADVEAALRATGEFEDVAVVAADDADWGQAVVACYPAEERGRAPDWERVRERLSETLPAFKRPKRYVALAAWPRNAQGKLNRATLMRAIAAAGANGVSGER
ncbi:AMP-binding protein [Horticoccus luteus]|uniref:AMP-binding protein n=1 Tax=Horticoccus luteus TaxID=2862869 RepID=A0A8F9TY27_9BACT|nr:AMP-binding protein [Horticoccus luteus]QYM80240.1 AMP-binding protein [Horticoccus luteus]